MKQITNITGKRISGSREGFVKLLQIYRPYGSSRNRVTVVFDGYADSYTTRLESNINIVFSKQVSADEKIINMVTDCKNPKCAVVVTDDKQIKFLVKSKVHKVMSCKDFMKSATRNNELNKNQKSFEKLNISRTREIQITKELERIWLNGKKD